MSTVATTAKKRSSRTERRADRRSSTYTRFPVYVYTRDMWQNGETPATGLLTDIGPSGLGIIINMRIKSGTEVLVTLHPTTTNEHQLEGKTIWINVLPSANRIIKDGSKGPGGYWRIGLRFDPDDKVQAEYIAKLLSSLCK